MAQIINTNMASLNAQRNLNKSQAANQTAMERLSSGLRINSAKDDAAGMAISTRFTSQIKGLNVAVRNAGDGIALAQTAEGALGSMTDNLQRIRELAVQSANATNSDVDREALQAEVDQLVSEIGRTASETDFNGRKLLDGSFKATFQIGANAGQTIDVSIAELTTDKLGSSMQAGLSAQGTDKKLSNGDLVINGENIRSSIAGDDALSFKDKETSAIAKVAAINASADKTGVSAKVSENVVLGEKIETGTAGTAVKGTIKLNGVEISLQGTDNTSETAKSGTRNSVVAAINAKTGQTGVVAEDGGANGGVILKAADGRNITVELTSAPSATGAEDKDLASLGLAGEGTSQAGFTLTAANANTAIKIEGGNGTGNGDVANAGLKAGTYAAQTAATSSTSVSISGVGFTAAGIDNATPALAGAAAVPATDFDFTKLDAAFKAVGVELAATVATGTLADDVEEALKAAFTAADLDPDTVTFAGDGAAADDMTASFAKADALVADLNKLADAQAGKVASDRALQDGDLVINGVAIGASSALDDTASNTTAGSSDGAGSAIAIAAAINKSYDSTGVKASVNATEFVGKPHADASAIDDTTKGSTLTLNVNGAEIELADQGDYEKNKAAAISAINERSGETGVTAKDNGTSLTLTAADGRNITLGAKSAVAPNAAAGTAGDPATVETNAANFGLTGVDTKKSTEGTSTQTVYGTVTLTSSKAFEVSYGTGGAKGLEDSGLVAGKFGGGEDGQALSEIDISTFEGAQKAITAIDNAIGQVASQRADLGAVQNRMESTVSNLQITAENLNSANSRIMDADFAAETAEMSRTNVLQQAGISILAQANASGQQVLSLLG